ncbi:MAG TPA: hypothetical protein PL037_07970 [Elusimicrobiales bacterium]|nr:hypothetical protein [Elusimicrobiales bacterium]
MTVSRALLPVWGLIANVVLQVAAARAGMPLLRSVFAGFAAGSVPVIWVSGLSPALPGDMLAYGCFGYCYFHFLNLGETARRIRLVRELFLSRGGLSEEGLLARYGSAEILSARIKRLTDNGQLVFRGGRYFIGRPAVLVMARIMTAMKLAVIGRKSEFDA